MIETTIPCLSLWQPWATLMASGAKKIETRSWATAYRGPLAIHAAKKWNGDLYAIATSRPFFAPLKREYGALAAACCQKVLPFGAIVCVVNLDDCRRLGAWVPDVGDTEIAFGDYSPGRFAWLTGNLRKLARPVPCRGGQRIFRVPLPAELSSPSPRAQE